MEIKQEVCTQCANCIPTCPVDAIYVDKTVKHVVIDQEKCVECGVCYRSGVCESSGLTPPQLSWPRSIRAALSDPLIVHKETRIPGRGTEEMKTNDVTGRYRMGHIGLAMEMGRPGTGTLFHDVEKVTMACARHGVTFEPKNPVTSLIVDKATGQINPEVLNERVLSAIIEFEMPLQKLAPVLESLRTVAAEIDTVFSLNAIGLTGPDGSNPVYEALISLGVRLSPNGKNNLGLGKPAYDFFGGNGR